MSERRMGHFAKIEEALHLTGKTHLTVGTAATILITQPSDWKSFLLCMGAAAVGSCVSDIDVSTSGSHKGLQRILILIGPLRIPWQALQRWDLLFLSCCRKLYGILFAVWEHILY